MDQNTQRASRDGNIDAMAYIGAELMHGSDFSEIDYVGARSYLQQAAEHDHPGALFNLGNIYYQGLGVPADANRAYSLALRAARAGYPLAQYNVAVLLTNGDGVPQDHAAAHDWMNKANAEGLPQARLAIARAMRSGQLASGGFDEIEALLKSILAESNAARFELAMLYLEPKASPQHLINAASLLQECYEIAFEKKDTLLEHASRAASPAAVKSMVGAMQSMDGAQQESVIITRFLFDERSYPYPNRSERYKLFHQACMKCAKVRGNGSLEERHSLKAIMIGLPAQMPLSAAIRPPVQKAANIRAQVPKVGRNTPCPCGSSQKFKTCCGR